MPCPSPEKDGVKDIMNGGGKPQKDTMIRRKIKDKQKIMPLGFTNKIKSHTCNNL